MAKTSKRKVTEITDRERQTQRKLTASLPEIEQTVLTDADKTVTIELKFRLIGLNVLNICRRKSS